jgi:hypothetical protein
MTVEIPPTVEWLYDEDTVWLELGSKDSGATMFYWLNYSSINGTDMERWSQRWSQPIPDSLELAEGEYYALVKGLRAALEAGYSIIEMPTNSPPILNQIHGDENPPPELEPFYAEAIQLKEQFDTVRIGAYGVDMRGPD